MIQNIIIHRLENGLEVAIEPMTGLGSVSIGFWLRHGSRNEPQQLSGISHIIEHLLFKGTTQRTCATIATDIDQLGGNVDAFTSKEMASYVAKVRDIHFDETFRLLVELLSQPLFATNDIEMERSVVLEELRMVHDTPDDLVGENFHEVFFPHHSLGRSILGSKETIESLSEKEIRSWFNSHYHPGNIVLTVAGNVDPDHVISLAEKSFTTRNETPAKDTLHRPVYGDSDVIVTRNRLEQVQLMIGFPAYDATDEKRHALEVLSTYLGGSMSSRLFQEIRENRGLAYNIQAYTSSFHDAGFLAVYAATSSDKIAELLHVLQQELTMVRNDGVKKEDISRIKSMLETEFVLGMEGSSSRM